MFNQNYAELDFRAYMLPWDTFDKFEDIIDKYMLPRGEGETLASQTVTACNKLVYMFYNNGDIYDNRYYFKGGYNDIASYANWLFCHSDEFVRTRLRDIEDMRSELEYTQILYDVCTRLLDEDRLAKLALMEKDGSIYTEAYPFKCEDNYHEDWEDEDDEDEDDEW